MKTITRDAEVKLVEALSNIAEDPQGWVTICFAFSRLADRFRSDNQIRIAVNLIQSVLEEKEAIIFLCDDATIFVMAHHISSARVDKLIFQLRYLFMDDPLAYSSEGEENPDFCKIYHLDRSLSDIMAISKQRLTNRIKGVSGGAQPDSKSDGSNAGGERARAGGGGAQGKSLNAASLANIERDLSNADLSKVLRRQPICAAVPDTMVRRVFDEIYINIAHLRKMLGTEVDLLGNRWLFNYLTLILDDRMLNLLQRSPARYLDNPISLNLNILTLLSDEFTQFDASIKPSVKFSIVIEIQLADVFADMAAFLAAKSYVQKLGYRVCLDGVTDLSFNQIDRRKLGFDLIKLQWNADIHTDINTEANQELASSIRSCGANRVILTRCDNRSAIDYGQAMGISLFQGRYLDSLINPKSTVEN